MKSNTIAAIATAMTNSGIGIIRISGEDAVEVADRIIRLKENSKRLTDCSTHTVHYGFVVEEETVIDEVMVLLMRAPRSYTREDTVEIDCHGGILIMQKILDLVIQNGARAAEPGEFTKRAFLNGRMLRGQDQQTVRPTPKAVENVQMRQSTQVSVSYHANKSRLNLQDCPLI